MDRNQRPQVPQNSGIIKQFSQQAVSANVDGTASYQLRMPTVFDASTNRRVRNGQPGTNEAQSLKQAGVDRERMKDLMADSFSRHETIAILPGFKEDGRPGKPCIKVNPSNSQQLTSEKPPIGNVHWKQPQPVEKPPQYRAVQENAGGKTSELVTQNSSGRSAQPWPYSQKSQQSIRETQAAYRRDLEKQIEEKRLNKDKNIRKSVSSSAATGEPVNSKPVNQSVSLEEFRNTGFLPPWFDPVKNNPLYSKNMEHEAQGEHSDSQQQMSNDPMHPPSQLYPNYHPDQQCMASPQQSNGGYTCQLQQEPPPCDYYVVPKEVMDQINRNNGCVPMQVDSMPMYQSHHQQMSHQQFYGPPPELQQHRGLHQGMINMEPPFQPGHPQPPNLPPQQILQYIHGPSQQFQRQVVQPVPHPAVSVFPFLQSSEQHPEMEESHHEEHQKAQYQQIRCHPQEHMMQHNSVVYNNHLGDGQHYAINLRNLPPPPTPPIPEDHNAGLRQGKFGNRSPCKILENMAEPIKTDDQATLELPPQPFEEESDGVQCDIDAPSQESAHEDDEIADTDAPQNMYKAELAKQIEEKKRKQQEMAAREEEESAKFEKKIQDDQRRIVEEYEEEQRKQKIKHEEFLRRQEAFLKERESFEKEAELERTKKRSIQKRNHSTPRPSEGADDEDFRVVNQTPRLIAPESYHDVYVSSGSLQKLPLNENGGSPRPRTVVISHNISSAPDPRCKDIKNSDNAVDLAAAGDAKVDDVVFLTNLKKAIVAEDERMTKILNKKRPLILASHFMSS